MGQTKRLSTDAPGIRVSEVDSVEDIDSENVAVKENADSSPEADDYNGFLQREAKRMARIPRIYLGAAALTSILLSVIVSTNLVCDFCV